MAFGWLKKVFVVGKAGVDIAAKIDPKHFGAADALIDRFSAPVELMIEAVEASSDGVPGGVKKALVETVPNLTLDGLVAAGKITPEQAAAAKTLRGELIDTYVLARNAERQYTETKAAYEALMASFQAAAPSPASTPTPLPAQP